MEAPVTVRVMLVDDHVVVRRGIEHVLSDDPDLQIVAELGDGESAIREYPALRPDVVLLDMRMPGQDGLETAKALFALDPEARIIALSSFTTRDLVEGMLAEGVRGYLPKEVSEETLKAAIRHVATGGLLEPPPPQDEPAPAAALAGDHPILGGQQRRVLALMVKGLTNPEIAGLLRISLPTARYHVSAILKKLDVSNRSEAVAFAVRESLVGDSDID
jgi:Response regulator containing a CheY-like receiver domain and an HTH DNA-binding domain